MSMRKWIFEKLPSDPKPSNEQAGMTIDNSAQLKTLSQQHPGKIEQSHWKQETGGDSPKDRFVDIFQAVYNFTWINK